MKWVSFTHTKIKYFIKIEKLLEKAYINTPIQRLREFLNNHIVISYQGF
jgi:hypothetical protein